MTPDDKACLQLLLERLQRNPVATRQRFWTYLDAVDPTLRGILSPPGVPLDPLAVLAVLRSHLDPPDSLVPFLWRAGRRLGRRGLGPRQCESLRRAITATLADELGVAFGGWEQAVWREFLAWTLAAVLRAGGETGRRVRAAEAAGAPA